MEAAPLGWLLVSRIVAGNDRARALTGMRMSHERISQDKNSPSEKLGKLYSGQPLDLKTERSIRPQNTLNRRGAVWVISVALETVRQLHAIKLR